MEAANNLFPVLSTAKVKRATETGRPLAEWFANSIKFSAVDLKESGQCIEELSQYIDDDIRRYLIKHEFIEKLFPVQKCLVPVLTTLFESRRFRRPNDICVSSPTGSGKTLAYAIPIVNYLNKSLRRSLRALVILPTHDLATQVFKTFQKVATFTHVRCGLAVVDRPPSQKEFFRKLPRTLTKPCAENTEEKIIPILSDAGSEYRREYGQDEYVSLIDVLVATPGVLVDLLRCSPGFSLADLEILVLDEADRLISSLKHDWLNTIERSIYSTLAECPCNMKDSSKTKAEYDTEPSLKKRRLCFSSTTGCALANSMESRPLHKLLFSATMSTDPEIITHMKLFQPRMFMATKPSLTGRKIQFSTGSQNSTPAGSPVPGGLSTSNHKVYTKNELITSATIPEQLEEKMFIIEAKEKMFIIWYLMHELRYKKVICFTNQIPTSYKLCKFMNEIEGVRAVEFSSNMKQETRQKFLNEFKADKIEVIVCTDIMARGIDLEGVEYVISYDMPESEIFYVHRVGRTARAGKSGTAITLVDTKQLVQFKKVVQLAHKMPNSMRLSDVVEEMKVPLSVKKNPEKYDLYTKTLENFEDVINKKPKFVKKAIK